MKALCAECGSDDLQHGAETIFLLGFGEELVAWRDSLVWAIVCESHVQENKLKNPSGQTGLVVAVAKGIILPYPLQGAGSLLLQPRADQIKPKPPVFPREKPREPRPIFSDPVAGYLAWETLRATAPRVLSIWEQSAMKFKTAELMFYFRAMKRHFHSKAPAHG